MRWTDTVRIALVVGIASAVSAHAEPFPSRPIVIVVPLTAGGGVDVSVRRYAEIVGRNIGQRIVIENKLGGAGVVAAMSVKQARPDGHTLFLASPGTQSTLQWMQTLPYDPVKDFEPISQLFYFPAFLTVPARLQANSVAELIALARTTPGGLTYGSQGVGSNGHLLGLMLQMASGAPLVHVPYSGGAPMNLDLLLGRLDFAFSTFNFMHQHYQDGKVRYLAAALPERSPRLPQIPTMAEAGYPGLDIDTWFGLLAPAGTPPDVIATLNREFVKVSQDKELFKQMDAQGYEIKTGTPAEFSALMAHDAARIGKVIKAAGAKPN